MVATHISRFIRATGGSPGSLNRAGSWSARAWERKIFPSWCSSDGARSRYRDRAPSLEHHDGKIFRSHARALQLPALLSEPGEPPVARMNREMCVATIWQDRVRGLRRDHEVADLAGHAV